MGGCHSRVWVIAHHPPITHTHTHTEVKRQAKVHTHSLVKKQAMEVQHPHASTWEAKKNRHSEHTQLGQEAGNTHTHTWPAYVVGVVVVGKEGRFLPKHLATINIFGMVIHMRLQLILRRKLCETKSSPRNNPPFPRMVHVRTIFGSSLHISLSQCTNKS